MATGSDEPRQSIVTNRIIEEKWTTLVTAISLDTMGVADECLSRGLIPGEFYDKMANDEGRNASSKFMARNLLIQINRAIKLDDRRYDKFVHILEERMPMGKEEKIVKHLKEEGRRVQSTFKVKSVGIKFDSVDGIANIECKTTFSEEDHCDQLGIREETVNDRNGEGNNKSSVSMTDLEVNTNNVVNIKNEGNQKMTKQLYYMCLKKQIQCQLINKNMGDNIIILVPGDYTQWRKKDIIFIQRYWLQLLMAFIIIGLVVLLLFLKILIVFIVGLVLTIGLFMFYKMSTGKESQNKFRTWYEVSLLVDHWVGQDSTCTCTLFS